MTKVVCLDPGETFNDDNLEWKEGVCLDENRIDQNWGGLQAPKNLSDDGCLKWCNQQKLATGCEYQRDIKKCTAHTYSVSYASGDNKKGSLCSVILPEGLFFNSINQNNFLNKVEVGENFLFFYLKYVV